MSDFIRLGLVVLWPGTYVLSHPELVAAWSCMCWPAIRSSLEPNWAGVPRADFLGIDVPPDRIAHRRPKTRCQLNQVMDGLPHPVGAGR